VGTPPQVSACAAQHERAATGILRREGAVSGIRQRLHSHSFILLQLSHIPSERVTRDSSTSEVEYAQWRRRNEQRTRRRHSRTTFEGAVACAGTSDGTFQARGTRRATCRAVLGRTASYASRLRRGVIENNASSAERSTTYLEGGCSYICVDSGRGSLTDVGARSLSLGPKFVVHSTSVDCLFSMSLPHGDRGPNDPRSRGSRGPAPAAAGAVRGHAGAGGELDSEPGGPGRPRVPRAVVPQLSSGGARLRAAVCGDQGGDAVGSDG